MTVQAVSACSLGTYDEYHARLSGRSPQATLELECPYPVGMVSLPYSGWGECMWKSTFRSIALARRSGLRACVARSRFRKLDLGACRERLICCLERRNEPHSMNTGLPCLFRPFGTQQPTSIHVVEPSAIPFGGAAGGKGSTHNGRQKGDRRKEVASVAREHGPMRSLFEIWECFL